MAKAASSPFSVAIRVPATSSTPTVQDERDTYTLWGWTWTEATANPVYSSAPGYNIPANEDIHGNPEGDDLWAYLQAYTRRNSHANYAGYKARADAWRNYWVNSPQFVGELDPRCHICLWGLVEYAQTYSDTAALSAAVSIAKTQLYNRYITYGPGPGWPVPGSFHTGQYGHRGNGRNLKDAVVVADASGDANIIELRDRLIDLFLQDPGWDATNGMHWASEYNMQDGGGPGAGLEASPYNLDYTSGDRHVSPFHLATVTDAYWAAWNSPNVSAATKAIFRDRIIRIATWVNANGVNWTYQYAGNFMGIYGAGGSWHDYALVTPVTSWQGVYTIPLVNMQVMAYKFTGDRKFLDATPASGKYPAKFCFNRGTKALYGEVSARECADDVAGHFQDTQFDSSTGNRYLDHNKGEFQYTYLVFENGGVPTVL